MLRHLVCKYRMLRTRDMIVRSIAKSFSPTYCLVLCRQKHHDCFVAIQVAAPDLGLKRRKVLDWIHIAEEGGIVRLPQHQNECIGSVICGNYLIS